MAGAMPLKQAASWTKLALPSSLLPDVQSVLAASSWSIGSICCSATRLAYVVAGRRSLATFQAGGEA